MLESLIAHFLYYPDFQWATTPGDYGLAAEDVTLGTADGVRLHGWFFRVVNPVVTLLFCHGNAGNVSHRLDNVRRLVECGLQVFIFDYRGYGHSEGSPSERGLYLDAQTAFAYLQARRDVNPAHIVVFGRSLGGAVAIDLATRVPAAGLIVESSFTSLRAMMRQVLGGLPVPDLHQYESLNKIGRVGMPVLIIHGEGDELIPVLQGRQLYALAPQPREWYLISGAGHNDTYLVGGQVYLDRLLAFVTTVVGVNAGQWSF